MSCCLFYAKNAILKLNLILFFEVIYDFVNVDFDAASGRSEFSITEVLTKVCMVSNLIKFSWVREFLIPSSYIFLMFQVD